MGKSIPSCQGEITGFSSHPLSYDKGEFPAGAVNRAVSSHLYPWRAGIWDRVAVSANRWPSLPVLLAQGLHKHRSSAEKTHVHLGQVGTAETGLEITARSLGSTG